MIQPRLNKKSIFIAICLFVARAFFPVCFAQAQNSILAKILKKQDAIVSIAAENTALFKSPRRSAAIDRRTGRLLVARNIKAARYNRVGAGVLIHPYGIIVTNAHTVHNADKIVVTFRDNQSLRARLIRVVKDLDIAFIQTPLPYPIDPVRLADSNNVRLGDEIITIGNSEFLKQTVTGGKINSIGTSRHIKEDGKKRIDLIRTTVNLYSGDSGGPLFDRSGRLIGLMTAKETAADHSSFAIPSNKIKKYLNECLDILNGKKVQ